MSIKIHHGPNGSYKTSGAIQDDAVPALKDGRVIITNVRGFTLERAYQVFRTCPTRRKSSTSIWSRWKTSKRCARGSSGPRGPS